VEPLGDFCDILHKRLHLGGAVVGVIISFVAVVPLNKSVKAENGANKLENISGFKKLEPQHTIIITMHTPDDNIPIIFSIYIYYGIEQNTVVFYNININIVSFNPLTR
jgi:hypothetical protein